MYGEGIKKNYNMGAEEGIRGVLNKPIHGMGKWGVTVYGINGNAVSVYSR